MEIKQAVVGVCATNCYVVINEKSKEGLIIDPGDKPQRIIPFLQGIDFKPVAILLTHGHFDHAGAAEEVAKLFNVPVYAHEMEKAALEDPDVNLSGPFFGKPEYYHADHYLKDEQEIDLAGFHIRTLFTPGHTKGGCCYYFAYENCLFSGDTLFAQSVGRTDFPGGSMGTLVNSIKEKLMVLPGSTEVYPGHNDATTIDTERMYNPYL